MDNTDYATKKELNKLKTKFKKLEQKQRSHRINHYIPVHYPYDDSNQIIASVMEHNQDRNEKRFEDLSQQMYKYQELNKKEFAKVNHKLDSFHEF